MTSPDLCCWRARFRNFCSNLHPAPASSMRGERVGSVQEYWLKVLKNLSEDSWHHFSGSVCWSQHRFFDCGTFTYFPSHVSAASDVRKFFLTVSSQSKLPFYTLSRSGNENISMQGWYSCTFFFLHNLRLPEAWTRITRGSMDFRIRPFGHFDSVMGGKTVSQNQTILLHSGIMCKIGIPSVWQHSC